MNRAERRRYEKLRGTSAPAVSSSAVKSAIEEGKAHHQAGRLQEAEQAYRRALGLAPDHPHALHYLGLLAYRVGDLEEASGLLEQACRQEPNQAVFWFNLGVVSHKAGRFEMAERAYRHAVKLQPTYVEARSNLGNVYKDIGRLGEAEASYRGALQVNPRHAEAHNNLGVVLKEAGQLEEALAAYDQALALKPNHAEAWNNRGLVLMELDRIAEARMAFERALQIAPHYLTALYNLGMALLWQQDIEAAAAQMRRVAEAKLNHGRPVTETSVYVSRLKHDAEQVGYLLERKLVGEEVCGYLAALQRLRTDVERVDVQQNRVQLPTAALQPIQTSFNRILHVTPCARLPKGTLNPGLDVAAIEGRYHAAKPEVIAVDELLTIEALEALRRFCWESTIWKKDYENGYVGAFLGDGFATPLLFQIAEELRLRFPNIFGRHRLTQAWAFKHDSARKGLNIHADAAAVNVNFWITPDEANLNARTGGLVVWDKEAPRDWNFKEYNSDRHQGKIYDWLQANDAKTIRIPYRANRAVVFNSDLFHETDEVSFRDEYLSRRINITLLYGYRLSA